MESRQHLIDSLTSHISLYHRHHQSSSSQSSPNPTRSSIIKWFSTLSLHHRLAAITTVDHAFVQTLLQMLHKLHLHGPSLFFLLPDLPSDSNPNLPSICFRQCDGLLARVRDRDECGRAIWSSVRMFEAKEGEKESKGLDTVSFGEEMVEDVGRFVEVMDGVSGGGFLRGEHGGLSGNWVEMGWLKERGYYGIEEFVVNRVEVSLRLAWIGTSGSNGNGGGKRRGGVKLKDKVVDVVGVAANAYWRKKGLVDWWQGLDVGVRRNVVAEIFGKRGRALVLFFFQTFLYSY